MCIYTQKECAEGICYPHAHFSGAIVYTPRGYLTLFVLLGRLSQGLSSGTGRSGYPRFLLYGI